MYHFWCGPNFFLKICDQVSIFLEKGKGETKFYVSYTTITARANVPYDATK